jgi:hypothetical protein
MPSRLAARIRGLAFASLASILFVTLLFVALLLVTQGVTASAQTAVTTYHNDNNRTGWNATETSLTPANVKASSFGLLYKVSLDDQVDAQPLVVPGVNITAGKFQGTHDVVYVATGNDTVYAIDADAGTVLLSVSLGTPVTYPLGCGNNAPHVGVDSTPVIDRAGNNLYVMAYTQASNGPTYTLHALDLGNLTDKITPTVVRATRSLSDGTTFNFNATYQRQRPALLLADGNVYAGFGSFCDFGANLSRGWLLGWNSSTLAPLSANQLNDTQATSPDTFFLSSIWMSGYGPSTDDAGNILFVTGNSDYSGNTYDGVSNIQESVVKISSDLTTVLSIFTPSNVGALDQSDNDFGSGGVLVLPDQPGSTPHLAVALGKVGQMFLMNEDSLGGYSTKKNNVLGTYTAGGCWCGESYYVDPTDGLARVVSSGGTKVQLWKLQTSPSPKLTAGIKSAALTTGQDPGFFTSVSSNGTASPIIWAIARPSSQQSPGIYLYAFNPDSSGVMATLFRSQAGTWPNQGGNANLVPTVANGKVYVAGNKQLDIFGLKGQKAGAAAKPGKK